MTRFILGFIFACHGTPKFFSRRQNSRFWCDKKAARSEPHSASNNNVSYGLWDKRNPNMESSLRHYRQATSSNSIHPGTLFGIVFSGLGVGVFVSSRER